MASVYNSTSGSSPFTGQWEDVQIYTSVITTIKSIDMLTVNLQWVNSIDDSPPNSSDLPLVTDSFVTDSVAGVTTKEYSTRCRWVRVTVVGTGSFRLATTYKRAPTEIKLTDETTNIVSVNVGDTNNSLYTVLSDMSGASLRSTGANQTGSALYTNLADGSGNSLATTNAYRYISHRDTSHYSFVATDEANIAANTGANTIIFHEGTLRLAVSTIGVKHGDEVQFMMLRSDDTANTGIGTQSLTSMFNNTATVSGHIKVTGQVQYVAADACFARINILTQQNTSDWFNPKVGFNATGTIQKYETLSEPNKHWVGVNHLIAGDTSIWYFKDSSASTNISGGSTFPSPDDFYNIIADISGFNCSATGISVSGANYQYPLDPRLIRWSQKGTISQDCSGVAIMKVSKYANTKEALCVAVRDSCNNNLSSTGAGVTTYQTDNKSKFVPHVLYLIDGTDHFPGTTGGTGTDRLKALLRNFVTPLAAGLPSASRGTVIIYDTSSSAPGQVNMFVDSLGITTGESDDMTSDKIDGGSGYPGVAALSISNMGDYLSALSALAQGRIALSTDSNVNTKPHNTVILVSGYSNFPLQEREDQGFDACFNAYFGKMRRIAVSNYLSPDMLNFTSGNPNNFFPLKQSPGTQGQFQTDISAAAQLIAQQLTQSAFAGHNALSVHTSDAKGHSQAATGPVAEATFGSVAMYYSLSDSSGSSISTYQTQRADGSNNALYVTLADGSGVSISNNNGLYIAMDSKFVSSYGFDVSIGGKLVTLYDMSSISIDPSVTGFNMNNLSIANESAVPIWVKVYDVCSGQIYNNGGTSLAGVNGVDPSATGLLPFLKYNFAVPATDYRDLQFSKPVLFNRGIYFAASTNFRYDSLDYPPGRAPIFINGNYSRVTQ